MVWIRHASSLPYGKGGGFNRSAHSARPRREKRDEGRGTRGEGRRKSEEGGGKGEAGSGKTEEGRRKTEEGREEGGVKTWGHFWAHGDHFGHFGRMIVILNYFDAT